MTTIWYSRCPAPTAASIAIRQGWLDEEFAADGISVRSLAEATDERLRLAHYSHDHPALFRFGGYVPPLIAQSRGADLKVIGLTWHDRVSGFFALPETGLCHGADLKHCRIALPIRRNDGVDWWRATVLAGIDQLLRVAGLEAGDVSIVPVAIDRTYFADASISSEAHQSLWGARSQFAIQREEVAALYRGEVEAIYSDAVQAAVLQATTGAVPVARLRGNEDDSEGGFGHPCVLTVSARLLHERPDLVDRWVARLLDAQPWARANPLEARRIFADDTGLPEALLDRAYSPRLTDQADVSLSDDRVALLGRKTDHLLRHGFLAREFDFDAMIDHGPLDRAMAARAAGQRV